MLKSFRQDQILRIWQRGCGIKFKRTENRVKLQKIDWSILRSFYGKKPQVFAWESLIVISISEEYLNFSKA